MSIFSHFSLQKALFELLSGDATLSALITGIFDKVPDNTQFPYVLIGDFWGSDWSSKTTCGMEFNIMVKIFSREGGRREATEIMERLYLLLHDIALSVEDQNLVMIRFSTSSIILEPDGQTYQGSMRFKVFLQAI